MKIGVFDSGIGGLSVARALEQALPEVEVVFVDDRQHMPYGDKAPTEVLALVLPILKRLEVEGCDLIVIACNTVTTYHIAAIRQELGVPVVGMEPMVKSAAELTRSGVIAVCATPATLASARYGWLKDHYAKGVTVLEPDCSKWALMIERDAVRETEVAAQIETVCAAGADVIVLGCTHYHWIEELIGRRAAGRAKVIQPEPAVVRQVQRVLARLVAG